MEEPRVCAEHERRRQAHEQAMAVRRSSLHRCEPDQVPRVCLSRCDPSPAAPPLQCAIEACLGYAGESGCWIRSGCRKKSGQEVRSGVAGFTDIRSRPL